MLDTQNDKQMRLRWLSPPRTPRWPRPRSPQFSARCRPCCCSSLPPRAGCRDYRLPAMGNWEGQVNESLLPCPSPTPLPQTQINHNNFPKQVSYHFRILRLSQFWDFHQVPSDPTVDMSCVHNHDLKLENLIFEYSPKKGA